MTSTPECWTRPGQKEPTLVVLLPRLWDKLSRFPLQFRLRIEVPLWRDLTTAKHPNADLPAEEDSASDTAGK